MEDHAYELIIAGWPIFPCNGKVPCIAKKDGGNGHFDATLDDQQVAEWWTKYPTANIGCRLPGHIIVIDVDPRSGGSLQGLIDVAGAMSPTLRSFSGRGDGGMHLFYDRDGLGKIDRSRLPQGVDIKDHDGYVILPPSIHPDTRKPYRWDDQARPIMPLPEGLRRLLAPAPRPARRSAGFAISGLGDLAQRRLVRMLETIAGAAEGSRNDVLNDLAYKAVTELGVGTNAGVYDLFLDMARECGLPDNEIRATLKSAGFRS
jgi:hypothetical protein